MILLSKYLRSVLQTNDKIQVQSDNASISNSCFTIINRCKLRNKWVTYTNTIYNVFTKIESVVYAWRSTTSFTLDFSVTNEKDLLVVVNNVIQEPVMVKLIRIRQYFINVSGIRSVILCIVITYIYSIQLTHLMRSVTKAKQTLLQIQPQVQVTSKV